MKTINHHRFAIVPVLSILAMSPTAIESNYNYRTIASVQVEKESPIKEAPARYNAMIEKIKPEEFLKNENSDLDKIKEHGEKLHHELVRERELFQKDLSDKKLVAEQSSKLKDLVIKSHLLKLDIDHLESVQASDADELRKERDYLEDSILIIESLLINLEENELLVAASDTPALEVLPQKSDAICELEEQNKVLTAKLEKLVEDQNNIMQTVLGMAQMMVSMFQQQQISMPNPYYANGLGFQYPYQYQTPVGAGNWVYYPSGFQPGQSNIFSDGAQSSQQGQSQMPQSGLYPDQIDQPSWNLQPQMNFSSDPRYSTQEHSIGNFGSTPFSYDLTNNVPTISQY